MNDQEIRAAAIQAAATCAAVVDDGDPQSVLKIAGFMEAYIRSGEDAAHAHVNGWRSELESTPDQHASGPGKASGEGTGTQSDQGAPSSGPDAREGYMAMDDGSFAAQLLANEAVAATTRTQVKEIGARADADRLMATEVTVGDVTGSLRSCLNARWTALPKEKKPTRNPDLGL